MKIIEALDEQMDSLELGAAFPPDAMKLLVATSSGGPHPDTKTWATRRLPWPWAIGCTLDILVTGLFIARVSQWGNPIFIDSLFAGGLQFMSALFISCVGLGAAVGLFVMDISRTRDAVRRNYPVIGRFRYVFSMLGEFFRQ